VIGGGPLGVAGVIGEVGGVIAVPVIGADAGVIAGLVAGIVAPEDGFVAGDGGIAIAGAPADPPIGATGPGIAVGIPGAIGGFVAASLEHAHKQTAARLARDRRARIVDETLSDMRTSRRCSRKDAAHRVDRRDMTECVPKARPALYGV
jgi:hypothetical protein